MVQKLRRRLAIMKDAQIKLSREGYVGDTRQSKPFRLAAMKDVPIRNREEEYVSDTVPKRRITSADMKDVRIKLSKEEYALDMEQRPQKQRLANMKDVPTMQGEEGFV